jgi:aspartate racemase
MLTGITAKAMLAGVAAAATIGMLVLRRRSSRRASRLVGVLGGLGPMASALLARLIVEEGERAGASMDDEHACFILFQNPALPNSRKAAIGEGPSPLAGMVASFRALARAGATEVCVCCNTAHPFARAAAAEAGVPFLDMIDITAEEALRRLAHASSGGAPLTVGLLGTDATLRMGLYQDAIASAAVRMLGDAQRACVVVPDASGVEALQQCILDIKAGVSAGAGECIEAVARQLVARGAQCIITGCTELPICFGERSHPEFPTPIVSPVRARSPPPS